METLKNLFYGATCIAIGVVVGNCYHSKPVVETIERIRIERVDKSPEQGYTDLKGLIEQHPVEYKAIVNNMVSFGHKMLPAANPYLLPDGAKTHSAPYNLTVVVIEDSVKTGNISMLVATPYLVNTKTNDFKEIHEREMTGSTKDYTREFGIQTKEFIGEGFTGVKKTAGTLKEAIENFVR